MTDPGGDFREQVEFLADRAADERARVAASSATPFAPRKPVRRFLWIGALLALTQVVLFAYLSFEEQRQIGEHVERPNPLLFQQDCTGERYRTSRKLLQWIREHGESPETLDALLGGPLPKIPVDPVTRQPLVYRKVGKGFVLECPPGAR